MKEQLVGINSIMEALKGQREIREIYVQKGRRSKRMGEIGELARDKGIPMLFVEKRRLDQMYKQGNHQGIVALVAQFSYASLKDMLVLV